MAMSVIRCPFCDRRYNVTGIPSGTKVLCTSCRATLTVPASRRPAAPPLWRRLLPESSSAQVALGLVGGLVLATSAYLSLRTRETVPPAGEASAQPQVSAPKAAAPSADPTIMFVPPTREGQIQRFHEAIYREFGSNRFAFDQRSTSPFILAGESLRVTPYLMFNEFQDALESVERRFRQEFAEPLGLGPIDEILPVVIFTSRDSFDDYMRKGNNPPFSDVGGIYENSKRRAVFLHDGNSEGYRIDVVLHEAAHQLVHYYVRREGDPKQPQSWWLQEGMGTYFEQFTRSHTGRIAADPSLISTRLFTLKGALKLKDLPRLYELMGMDHDDIWKQGFKRSATLEEQERKLRFTQLYYGEAWVLVHYLRHGAGGKYRKLFDDYLLRELRGQGGKDEFIRLLSDRFGMELQQLQLELEDYIQTLPLP